MAARKVAGRDEDAVTEPVSDEIEDDELAVDDPDVDDLDEELDADDLDVDLDAAELEDDVEVEDIEDLDDDLEGPEDAFDAGSDDDIESEGDEEGVGTLEVDPEDGDDGSAVVAALPLEVGFDDDEEDLVAVVAGDDESDEEVEVDGLRDGEFVCRSCFMVMRESQLADPERLLCRDCV